ncbi:MAG: hypothetical protein PHS34_09455 [Candidatus Omnitrophica bacterium]|nr:hypothetical protein [Candidatus Omnitrophota bacterium]
MASKYLVLVNGKRMYGYENWQLLKINILENKDDKIELWKLVSDLPITYEPMDISELGPKPQVLPLLKCGCGENLNITMINDRVAVVANCENCKEKLIKGWLEVLSREVK